MDLAFIGAGIMGHGMAVNLLKAGHQVSVIAHKNRLPIDDLVSKGATEALSYDKLLKGKEAIFLCLTNSLVAESVINDLTPFIEKNCLIIDTTTHEPSAPALLAEKTASVSARYVEAPVTGGVKQAAEGVLGAIVACQDQDFEEANDLLLCFCKQVEHFGSVGMAAKTKLVSNFLALGTATLVVETFNHAATLGIDWKKLYELAQLGSGNSSAMHRIIGNALEENFQGYVFTNKNTLKDFGYIKQLFDREGLDSSLATTMKSLYEISNREGDGDLMLSERLKTQRKN